MLLSAVSVLVVAQSSSEVPEGLMNNTVYEGNDFGGLGVACWPLGPKFAGSNPAESVGFLRAKKSSSRLPSEGK